MKNRDDDETFDDEFSDELESVDSDLAIEAEDDDENDDEEPFEVRTAVMTKNNMLALLSLKTSATGGLVVRVDPREALPAAQQYEDSAAAAKWFKRSLMTSEKNGWTVVYYGEPLFG